MRVTIVVLALTLLYLEKVQLNVIFNATNATNATNASENINAINVSSVKERRISYISPTAQQAQYIKRFKEVAINEMKKYGIPASITLAQGLLESGAGQSVLAVKHNNHFGYKCFSKNCPKGHCANFTDDSHKDFFRKYTTAWESFRAHSILLSTSTRYKGLIDSNNDYKAWANGLQKNGYATSKTYAKDLIYLIESLNLDAFDKIDYDG
jgi:flagellum-specific peptidoglycan hydrolase FlgJ